MKPIKEKAVEIYPGHCNAYTDANNKIKRIGFEAGANYVLEQIESLTKYNRWSAQDLYDLIEQLKK